MVLPPLQANITILSDPLSTLPSVCPSSLPFLLSRIVPAQTHLSDHPQPIQFLWARGGQVFAKSVNFGFQQNWLFNILRHLILLRHLWAFRANGSNFIAIFIIIFVVLFLFCCLLSKQMFLIEVMGNWGIPSDYFYDLCLVGWGMVLLTISWGKFSQKHKYKYMAKWWCLLAMEKLHVSAYSDHHQVLTIFLL